MAYDDEYGYSDLGVPIGATPGEPLVTDYGQADLRPFAMGAIAQQRAYQPYKGDIATGTTPWKKYDIEQAQRDTPPDITNLDPASAKWLGQQAADLIVPTEPWEFGAMAMGPAGRVAGKIGKTAAAAAGIYGSTGGEAEASWGGRLAKTADLNMMRKAQDMFGRGAGHQKIWDETGWFLGPDNHWKFEIPDTGAYIKDAQPGVGKLSNTIGGPMSYQGGLGDFLHHPELFKAYPELANVPTTFGDTAPVKGMQASYMPRIEEKGWKPTKEEFNVYGGNTYGDNQISPVLHEVTHAIESREGFPKGTSPMSQQVHDLAKEAVKNKREQAGEVYTKLSDDRQAWIEAFAARTGIDHKSGTGYHVANRAFQNEFPDLEAKRQRMGDLHYQGRPPTMREKIDIYSNYAGEVAARNVQTRLELSPDELKAIHPYDTQAVPNKQQIVDYTHAVQGPSSMGRYAAMADYDPTKAPEMGFGSAAPGSNKAWLLRYNPTSGVPEFVNTSGPTGHAFSTIKTGAKPHEMSRILANEPAPYQYPQIDMAKLQREKAEMVFGPTDRMYGGGELTHVNKQKLDVPVKQEGGPNFPHLNRDAAIPDIPADAAPLYASVTESAAKKPLEVATAVRERGGVPYYVPVIMTHGGGDSSKQIANTGHQLLRQSEPSADAVAKINAAIAAKGGNAPDFADREAFQKWLDSGLPARTAFSKGLDTKEILKATGVDMGPIRYANTDPRLYSTPSGSAGIIMGEMRPELGTSRAPLHSNYPVTFFGQRDNIGGMAGNMPYSLLAPDQHRAMVPLHNRGISFATTPAMQHMRGLAGSIPKTQPVTQEVVDNYYEWFRRHPSGWMAAGAAPLGALAATGDYQPEERM